MHAERRRTVADDLLKRMTVNHESFWTAVYPLYMQREITRGHLRELVSKGLEEAKESGRLLKAEGIAFDVAFTSVLKRAILTLWFTLDEMDRTWLPVVNDYRLNERHYGALQGLNKADMAKQYGDEQVLVWRRSYDIPPPPLPQSDPGHPRFDRSSTHPFLLLLGVVSRVRPNSMLSGE